MLVALGAAWAAFIIGAIGRARYWNPRDTMTQWERQMAELQKMTRGEDDRL